MDPTQRARRGDRSATDRPRRRGPTSPPLALLALAPLLVAGTIARPTPAPGPATRAPRVDPAPVVAPSPERVQAVGSPTRPVTVAFAGDVLPHRRVNDRAASHAAGGFDFAPLLDPVRPVLERADLALCHLEVPIAPTGEAITAYPSFGAPAALVDGIAAAGWDGCSVASNHSLDRGVRGVATTLGQLDRVGLGHAGTARSRAEGGSITRYRVDGVRVAHLSYTYGLNGHGVPDDAPWTVNTIDPARIRQDAARAADAAEVVVVSLHWGTEGVHEPSPAQRALLDALLPSDDIDLVVGHHAHVVQPIERVAGTWVLFGLGNHLSNQVADDERDGLLALVTFAPGDDGWDVTGIEAVPTWVDLDTHRVVPATGVGADTHPDLRDQLAASHARTRSVLAPDGRDGPDLAVAP